MGVFRDRREFLKRVAASGLATSLAPWEQLLQPAFAAEASTAEAVDAWTSFRNGSKLWGIAHTTLPDQPELLWEVETPDGVTSTPVIAGGQTYVGTLSGQIHCLDLKTGEEKWSYDSLETNDPNEFLPGFNAPLTLSDSLVFAGDDQGIFHAVDRQSGERRWTFDTSGEIVGGATLYNDLVIFGSHSGYLYGFVAETGEKRWEVETLGPVNGTPSLAGKLTFTTGCDQPVLRVIDVEAGQQAHEIPIDSLMIASFAVRDQYLYFGTDSGAVFALDWQNKEVAWEYSVPKRQQQIHSSPAVTEDLIVIGSRDKHLHCLNRATGEPRWTYGTRAKIDTSPVVIGDRVLFGSADKNLYLLRLEDGELVWKHNAGQSFTGSPAVAEGCIVVGTDSTNGRILCFGKK